MWGYLFVTLTVLATLSTSPQSASAAPFVIFSDDMETLNGTRPAAEQWTETGFWHQVASPEDIAMFTAAGGCTRADYIPNDIFPDLVTPPDNAVAKQGVTNFTAGIAKLPQAFDAAGSLELNKTAWWYGVDTTTVVVAGAASGSYIDNLAAVDPGTDALVAGFNLSIQVCGNGGQTQVAPSTTASNGGTLTSPPIDLTGLMSGAVTMLDFETWFEVEHGARVLIIFLTTFSQIW